MRVLVICDDGTSCVAVRAFATEGWTVETMPVTGATDRAARAVADLALLHVRPGPAATQLCASLCARRQMQVVVMSDSLDEDEVVAGLRVGVDAFVLETVGPRELVARARALRRRFVRVEPSEDLIIVGPVALDRASRQVKVDDRPVPMPRREFDILEMLMRDAGQVVTRDELIRELWGVAPGSQTLDVQARRLRARLAAEEDGFKRIVTIRGVGYRFLTEITGPVIGCPDTDDGPLVDPAGAGGL